MKKRAFMTMVVTLAVAGVCSSQTADAAAPAAQEPSSRQQATKPAPNPPKDNKDTKQALSESAQKLKKGIEDTLEKTGEVVREALGNTRQGCLKPGNEADPYLLEQSDSAGTITVVGSADLAQHLNHTVRLQGREESDGRVFHVTTVEQIATSCDPLPVEQPGEDKAGGRLTASDQGTSDPDRKMTQAIRKSLVGDETLSALAKNIKIISQDGFVTLKGPVRSEDEKRNIEAKAAAVAGAGRVSNELTVDGNPGDGSSSGKN
jgi:osmotically-inducible protein OsmY